MSLLKQVLRNLFGSPDPKHLIVGRWVTHAKELTPKNNLYGPAAFIAAYHIKNDGTFSARIHVNLQGTHAIHDVDGAYSIAWNRFGFAEGILKPHFGAFTLALNFFVRSAEEFVWVMNDASDDETPIAHGVFLRASAVGPESTNVR